MDPLDKVTCIWCGKVYQWDWGQDEIKGAECIVSEFPGSEVDLTLYFCSCGGTLGVVTEEEKGSSLLIHATMTF
jgi:hypothetical protein